MKPSQFRQQQPRRSFNTDKADRMAGELCADMLSFMATRYEHASDDERIELIVRYAPAMIDLERTLARIARRQRRQRHSYPGGYERKSA